MTVGAFPTTAPTAAPSANPLVLLWVLDCCSTCVCCCFCICCWVGVAASRVCADAWGTIATVKESAITIDITFAEGFIWPPLSASVPVSDAPGEATAYCQRFSARGVDAFQNDSTDGLCECGI
jgi:hypothetical protein